MSDAGKVLLMFGLAGHWEILVIGGVVLLLFFGRRIPEVMRSLGRSLVQFKKGLREAEKETKGEAAAGEKGPVPPPEEDAEGAEEEREKPGGAPPAGRSPTAGEGPPKHTSN